MHTKGTMINDTRINTIHENELLIGNIYLVILSLIVIQTHFDHTTSIFLSQRGKGCSAICGTFTE